MSYDTSFSQTENIGVPRSSRGQSKKIDNDRKFISSVKFNESAELVFRKNLDVIYSARFLGTWTLEDYKVERKYVPSQSPGVKLYMTTFTPSKQIIGSVLIVHGFGEHQGRYVQIADSFAMKAYQVVLYDQRGSGKSGGVRGDTKIEQMHKDLDSILQYVNRSIPIFCYAHAFGAAVMVSFCMMNPQIEFQGIITTSALFHLPSQINTFKITLVSILTFLIPTIMVNMYPNYSLVSKNNYHIKKLAEDNLLSTFMTIGTAMEIIKLIQFILPNASLFNTPIFLLHGKLDLLVDYSSSLQFHRSCSSNNKLIKIFEFGLHELHSDSERERLQQLVLDWCSNSLQKESPRITNLKNVQYGIKHPRRHETKKKIFILLVFWLLIIYLQRVTNCTKLIKNVISKCLVKLMFKR